MTDQSQQVRASLAAFLVHAHVQAQAVSSAADGPRPSVAIQHGCGKDGTQAHSGWALRCYLPQQLPSPVSEALASERFKDVKVELVSMSRTLLLSAAAALAPMARSFVKATNMLSYWCWVVELGENRQAVTLAHPDRYVGGLDMLKAQNLDAKAILSGFTLALLHRYSSESEVWWLQFPWSKDGPSDNSEFEAATVVTRTAGLTRGIKDVEPTTCLQQVAAAGHTSLGEISSAMLTKESQERLTDAEESLLGYRLLSCAHTIHSQEDVSVVLLSGPSASGKTSIANRLALGLRSLGHTPVIVTLDDYYRSPNEPTYPKMPDGVTLNHELVECLRIDRFQTDMQAIIDLQPGKHVQLPRFDFVAQESLEEGPVISRSADGATLGRNLVIVEGIFSLDPKLTSKIPKHNKFGVFTSPLGVNIDEFHRIAADDLRVLRRIYRDYLHRGRSASTSIERTPGVAAGAVESIFPTMCHAEYFIDGGMAHEAWLLKDKTTAVLRAVSPQEGDGGSTWQEASRFLNQVLSEPIGTAASSLLPSWSVLEEFLGTPYVAELPSQTTNLVNAAKEATRPQGDAMKELIEGLGMLIQYRLLPEMNCPPEELLGFLCHGRLCSPFEEVADGAQQVFARNYKKRINLLTADAGANGALALEHQEVWIEQIRQETARFVLGSAARLLAVRGQIPSERGVFTVLHNYLASGTKAVNACFATWTAAANGHRQTAPVTQAELELLQEAVKEVLEANSPIGVAALSTEEAVALLTICGKPFSAALVASLQQPLVQVAYSELPATGDSTDLNLHATLYSAGPLAGCLQQATPFQLSLFDGGLRVSFHEAKPPTSAIPLDMSSIENVAATSAYNSHRSHVEAAMSLHTTAALNFALAEVSGEGQPKVGQHLTHLSNGLQMQKCFELANEIKSNSVKAVAVAGGSASGKSVFVSQLSHALTTLGLNVTTLSLDHYYMNADDPTYPVVPGTDGKQKNYETVDALRISFLNNQLEQLLDGKEVETPIFDLGKGQCTEKTVTKVLPKGSVLIVESLFALSGKIMPSVPVTDKRKIMLLPLPFIQLDELHPTNTEHLRILRRVYRDATERGRSAAVTLARAAAVGHGELENTLPFIKEADVVVSTTSMTEFHQLASECLRLLRTVHINAGDSIHAHAQMIRSYLEYFQPL